jgi:pyruvate/2-oxoglutarate dehydrogenase complex dihydrolipoamide acyltransferase (E2) component
MTNRKSISEGKKMKNYNPSVQYVIEELLSKSNQELIDEGFLGNLGQGIKQAAGGLVKGAKAVGQGVKQGVQTARGLDPKYGKVVPQNQRIAGKRYNPAGQEVDNNWADPSLGKVVPQNQRLPGMSYNQQGQQIPQNIATNINAANHQSPAPGVPTQQAAPAPAQQAAPAQAPAPVNKAPTAAQSADVPSDEDAQARFAQLGLQWDQSMSGKNFSELGKIMKQQQAQKAGPNNAQSPQPAQQPTQPAPQQAQAPVQQESVADMSLKEYQIYWEKQSKKAKK